MAPASCRAPSFISSCIGRACPNLGTKAGYLLAEPDERVL